MSLPTQFDLSPMGNMSANALKGEGWTDKETNGLMDNAIPQLLLETMKYVLLAS